MVSQRRPPIRLSYFGGGHYDSVVLEREWRANLLPRVSAGEREEQMVRAARLRNAPRSGAPAGVGAALAESDREATEQATLQAVIAASRAQWEAGLLDAALPSTAFGAARGGASLPVASAGFVGGAANDDERMDLALALRQSADEGKAAEGEDVERALLESLRGGAGAAAAGGTSGAGRGDSREAHRLLEVSASLTEEEQVQCVLAGLTPAQFIAQRDSNGGPPRPKSSAAAAAAEAAKGGGGAMEEEDEDLAMALLMSTQQYR
jgi:hypothetical protein